MNENRPLASFDDMAIDKNYRTQGNATSDRGIFNQVKPELNLWAASSIIFSEETNRFILQ
jgi:hypothetical protein